MTALNRRLFLAALAAVAASPARGQSVVADAAGRRVPVPAKVGRVFPAGPPAAILLYTLAPDQLLGWPRANRAEELPFLLPGVGDRPEVGRITGRGNSANLEAVLKAAPDLILDVGTINDTYVELADRVQAQTGIPYALLDGSFAAIPKTYETLGALVGRTGEAAALAAYCAETVATVRDRIAAVPQAKRPRVYYGRGPKGLETGLGGSINVETVEFMGAVNVAGGNRGGLATVSVEQVLAWDPEVIVTIDRDFAGSVRRDPAWAAVKAVAAGRVHLAPRLPFGWIDFPPSVNRMIGLRWLGSVLYPDLFPEDLRPIARDFYKRFYHVDPGDREIERVLSGA